MKTNRKIIIAIPFVLAILSILAATMTISLQLRQENLNHGLIAAVRTLDAPRVETLLRQGADPNAKDTGEPPPTFLRLVQRLITRFQRSAVSESSHQAEMPLLVVLTADLSTQKEIAAADAITVSLIEHGADIHVRGNRGQSVLDDAALSGLHHTVRLLLSRGVNVNDRDEQDATPLMEADAESTRLLLQHGADANARDTNGNTALILAFFVDHPDRLEIVTMLLEHGADVKPVDESGLSALCYAMVPMASVPPDAGIVRLLKRHGARLNKKDREYLAAAGTKPM